VPTIKGVTDAPTFKVTHSLSEGNFGKAVERTCAREGVPFDSDLFNELTG
jgi:hypothetical protein